VLYSLCAKKRPERFTVVFKIVINWIAERPSSSSFSLFQSVRLGRNSDALIEINQTNKLDN